MYLLRRPAASKKTIAHNCTIALLPQTSTSCRDCAAFTGMEFVGQARSNAGLDCDGGDLKIFFERKNYFFKISMVIF